MIPGKGCGLQVNKRDKNFTVFGEVIFNSQTEVKVVEDRSMTAADLLAKYKGFTSTGMKLDDINLWCYYALLSRFELPLNTR